MADGVFDATEAVVEIAEVAVGVGVVRLQLNRSKERAFGLVRSLVCAMQGTEVVVQLSCVPAEFSSARVGRGGLVEAIEF